MRVHKDAFGYQDTGARWLAERKNACLFDDMGVGKTASAIWGCDLAGLRRILVVVPGIARINWLREFDHWQTLPRSIGVVVDTQYVPDTDVVVVSYNALLARPILTALLGRRWDRVICDECFPADTQISVPGGSKCINEINPGDFVTACIQNSGQIVTRRVIRVLRKPAAPLVRVIHERGSFICTPNHKIWTDDGYYSAERLTSQTIWTETRETSPHCDAGMPRMRKEISYQITRSKYRTIMQPCLCPSDDRPTEQRPVTPTSSCSAAILRTLRNALFSVSLLSDSILREELFRQMASNPPAVACRNPKSQWQKIVQSQKRAHRFRRGAPKYVERAEATVPETGRNSALGPDGRTETRAELYRPSRRQRVYYNTAAGGSRCDGSADGAFNPHTCSSRQLRESTDALLRGLGQPGAPVGNRDRRLISSNETVGLSGSAKNGGLIRSRVVRIEILEPGSRQRPASSGGEDTSVYDLEVDGTHNYFAEGCLVSNCHYLKNRDATRTRAVFGALCDGKKGLVSQSDGTWLLSGTPFPSGPQEAWTWARALFPAATVGVETYAKWEAHFCVTEPGIWNTRIIGLRNVPDFTSRLRPHILRRLLDDVQPDLPPARFGHVVVEPKSLPPRPPDIPMEILAVIEAAKAKLMTAEENFIGAEAADAQAWTQSVHLASLRRWTGVAKAPAVAEAILEDLANGLQKIVIFAVHREVIAIIAEAIPEALTIHGDTPPLTRQAHIDAFQNRVPGINARVLLVNIEVASTNLTLTASAEVAFAETTWMPKDVMQGVRRCRRIGQTRSVLARVYSLRGSLDEAVNAVLVRRSNLTTQLEAEFTQAG